MGGKKGSPAKGESGPGAQRAKPVEIGEPEAAERELLWYKSMVTASSELMVLVDASYTYRAVNQAYCDAHQRTQEEILGHTVAEVFGEEAFGATLKPNMDRCLSGEQVKFSFWWDLPSGGRRHIDATYDPFFAADGSVSAVVNTMTGSSAVPIDDGFSIRRAAADLAIDLCRSVMVGDREGDALAGLAAGCRSVVLGTGPAPAEAERARDFPAAVALVLGETEDDG